MIFRTTDDVKTPADLKSLIRKHGPDIDLGSAEAAWYSHGYRYSFQRAHFHGEGHRPYWVIDAGCREWHSFAEMRKHYDERWRKAELDCNDYPYCGQQAAAVRMRRQHRLESLKICSLMQRYARRIGLRLRDERNTPAPKKRKRSIVKAKARKTVKAKRKGMKRAR